MESFDDTSHSLYYQTSMPTLSSKHDHSQDKRRKGNLLAEVKKDPGRWTADEHMLFLRGLQMYGKSWKKISEIVKTRTVVQIRTHAQKYLIKLEKAKKAGHKGVLMMDGKGVDNTERRGTSSKGDSAAKAKCASKTSSPSSSLPSRRHNGDMPASFPTSATTVSVAHVTGQHTEDARRKKGSPVPLAGYPSCYGAAGGIPWRSPSCVGAGSHPPAFYMSHLFYQQHPQFLLGPSNMSAATAAANAGMGLSGPVLSPSPQARLPGMGLAFPSFFARSGYESVLRDVGSEWVQGVMNPASNFKVLSPTAQPAVHLPIDELSADFNHLSSSSTGVGVIYRQGEGGAAAEHGSRDATTTAVCDPYYLRPAGLMQTSFSPSSSPPSPPSPRSTSSTSNPIASSPSSAMSSSSCSSSFSPSASSSPSGGAESYSSAHFHGVNPLDELLQSLGETAPPSSSSSPMAPEAAEDLLPGLHELGEWDFATSTSVSSTSPSSLASWEDDRSKASSSTCSSLELRGVSAF